MTKKTVLEEERKRSKPVNKKDVWKVCTDLASKNQKITNAKIIEQLGGGSHSTIGIFIKEYLEIHPNAAKYRKQRKYKIPAPILGGDFFSREKKTDKIKELFDSISGYWELYAYPMSSVNRVVRDILHIKSINEYGYIDCVKHGVIYHYQGFCFKVANEYPHLYGFLDTKVEEFPEIVFFILKLPPIRFYKKRGMKPPNIYGIYTAISVYNLDDNLAGPAATKVGLKYLGDEAREQEIKERLCKEYYEYFDRCTDDYKNRVGKIDVNLDLDTFLAKFGSRYFCPYELASKISGMKELIDHISNKIIFDEKIPFVLRT